MNAPRTMKALRYARRLINFNSVSSKSNRIISKYIEMKLTKHGFVVEKLEYRDAKDVRKVCIVAKKGGGSSGLAYFSHSDVVPAHRWFSKKYDPFQAVVANERLYGRGSCDMKGSIACMIAAAQRFSWDELKQPIYFVCTADEEIGFHGAKCVVEESKFYREMVSSGSKGIIGEPTSLDVINAHKGSVSIKAVSRGRSAHSATNEGINANLQMIPFLNVMKQIHDETESDPAWQNDLFDPPTLSWNIGINDRTNAINMTPPKSVCTVYGRTMPNIDVQPLIDRTQQAAEQNGLELEVIVNQPFFRDADSDFVAQSIELANRNKTRSVCYATDASVFSEMENLIVFGPGSIDQAHTSKEWISLEQLSLGTEMYDKMIRHWCC